MTEDKKFIRKKAAHITTIRDLPTKKNPVRVLGIVIDSQPGAALIQDLYDDVSKAQKIWVATEGTLEPKKKYLIIGEVTEKTDSEKKEHRLNATLVHDIDTLDIALYKEILELEDQVLQTMS
ncbi:hypothetical protein EU527_10380 [Candidatus Thorarchaeota archaeon]|nr:MAG: hypothetical protein EU527_10380 [Candidatus Thorarchaeota archaeon]